MPWPWYYGPQRPRDPAPGVGHPNGTVAWSRNWPVVRPCAAGRTGFDRDCRASMHEVIVEQFIASFKTAPNETLRSWTLMRPMMWYIGNQEDRVTTTTTAFCLCMSFAATQSWSVTCARSKIDQPSMPGRSWHLIALNERQDLATDVRIIFRGDSGFCRWMSVLWCERNNVGYIVGIAKNKRLNALKTAATRCTRLLCRIGCQGALVY